MPEKTHTFFIVPKRRALWEIILNFDSKISYVVTGYLALLEAGSDNVTGRAAL